MKDQNIKAYFAGDKSKDRIELAVIDAQENQSYWERALEKASSKVVTGAAQTALEAAQSTTRFFQKLLAKEVSHG